MATKTDSFVFLPKGGLNHDDSDYSMPAGDYRHARDIMVGRAASGHMGAGTLIPGTVPYPIALPEGRNKTIGYYEDRSSQRGILLNWNERQEHGIYLLDLDHTAAVVPVLVHYLLGFREDSPITGAAAYQIYKDGRKETLFFFTDGHNDPRCINLDTIGQVDKDLLEPRFINLAKCPPLLPPTILDNYEGDFSGPKGTFETGLVQMIYRYVYRDFQESAWSPVSRPISAAYFHNGLHAIKASLAGDVLDFPAGGPGQRYWKLIDAVEVAVRFSGRDPFRLWARLKPDGSEIGTIEFRNDGAYPAVADASWLKNYDAVPHRAVGLAGIDNLIVLGGITENFPAHRLLVSGVENRVVDSIALANGNRMAYKNGALAQLGIVYFDQAGRTPGVHTSEALKVELPHQFGRQFMNRVAKAFRIDSQPPIWAHSFQVVRTETLDRSWFVQAIVEDVAYILTLPDAGQKPTFIRRQIGTSGVRDGSAWKYEVGSTSPGSNMRRIARTGDIEQYYPLDTPIYEGGLDAEGNELVVARKTYSGFGTNSTAMRNEPIGRTASGKNIFFGGYDAPPENENRKPILEYMSTLELGEAKYLGFDIRNWSRSSPKSATESFPSNEVYYNFEKGDRVDLLFSQAGDYLGVLSLRIDDFRDNMLIVPITQHLLPQLNIALGRGTLVEVYRPRGRDQEPLFYECGECYKVVHPGTEARNHGVTELVVATGDAHLINKPQYASNYQTSPWFPVYAMHPDPGKVYEHWERGHGRALLAARDGVRTSPTEWRFSGKVFSDGQLNGTSSFNAMDGHTYPSEYGELTMLVAAQNNMVQDTGNILMGHFRNETVSVYVNRNTLQDLSGRTQVLESDRVLGSYNTLLGSFGLQDALASVGVDSRRYWWDDYKGVAVRYSRDGLTAISKVKMHAFFQAQKNRGLVARAGYDAANDTFLLTLGDVTIAWDEEGNRWCEFVSFAPELYGQLGGNLLSFVEGVPYLHGPGDANTYYGRFHQPKLELLFNLRPNVAKELQQVSLVADHAWHVTLESATPTAGKRRQATRVPAEGFAVNEETWEASVPRDHTTPNLREEARGVEGDRMRSSRVRVTLEGAVPEKAWSVLYEVALEYADSTPSPLADK